MIQYQATRVMILLVTLLLLLSGIGFAGLQGAVVKPLEEWSTDCESAFRLASMPDAWVYSPQQGPLTITTRVAIDFELLPEDIYEFISTGREPHEGYYNLVGYNFMFLEAIIRAAGSRESVVTLPGFYRTDEGKNPISFTWDGRNAAGVLVQPGNYEIEINGRFVPTQLGVGPEDGFEYRDLEGWSAVAEACTRILNIEVVEKPVPGRGPRSVSCAAPPLSYYSTVDASNPTTLRSTLHPVIDDHTKFPYTSTSTDTWDILNDADENPSNASQLLSLYKNEAFADGCSTGCSWNREHTWAKSFGFSEESGNGRIPYTDCHHLRAADIGYNSSRSNKPHDDCTTGCTTYTTDANNGSGGGGAVNLGNGGATYCGDTPTTGDVWETWDHRKGDVARSILYMDIRYEGDSGALGNEQDLIATSDLSLMRVETTSCGDGYQDPAYHGVLSALLAWHAADPVDADEIRRNDQVWCYQGNRNPFVDHPEWVACLYSGICSGGPIFGGITSAADIDPCADSSVRITWTLPSEWNDGCSSGCSRGFNVSRDGITITTGDCAGPLAAGETTCDDTTGNNSTVYTYRVQAFNNDSDSNDGGATADAGDFLNNSSGPIITSGPTATGFSDSFTAVWSTDDPSDSYLEWGAISGVYSNSTFQADDVTSHSSTATGLSVGTLYYYRVCSTDPCGNGPNCSGENTVTTTANCEPGSNTAVFINELHYDNDGVDTGEFVEIAGPAGTDLGNGPWKVELYTGSDGSRYDTISLSGTIDNEGTGYGALSFTRSGIQNGSPDGLALVNNLGIAVQFLCYEGTFSATSGAADGMLCTDIGVSEPVTTAVGHSIQLTGGPGFVYENYTWTGPISESPGSLNSGQSMLCGTSNPTFDGIESATDRDPCAATGVRIDWTPPPSWNDGCSSGCNRGFNVYRGATLITTGGCSSPLAEAAMTCSDTAGIPGASYNYSVEAFNDDNNTDEGPATIAAADGIAIDSVAVSPNGPLSLCGGDNQILSASVSGGTSPYTYQWTRDGSLISGATGSTYTASDTGTHSYNCQVTGSSCTAVEDASPTEISWLSEPAFAGLDTVNSPGNATCTLDLAWSAASACSGSVSYRVYRSTSSGFTPGASNRIADSVSGTSYSDTSGLVSGTTYFYVVRAVDGSSGGEDGNFVERSGSPLGPVSIGMWSDDLEPSAESGWTHDSALGTDDWALTTSTSHSSSHSWNAADVASLTDKWIIAPAKNIGSTSVLSFWHRFDLESGYDGAVIEISTNGGSSWTDLGSNITSNGYNRTISTGYQSPIGGRSAWSGSQTSWLEVNVNLAGYAGSDRLIRWRLACDTSEAAGAWNIDDISMTGTEVYINCGGASCDAPTFSGLNSAGDVDGCADTGVQLNWSAPVVWGDNDSGIRSYGVLLNDSQIATLDSSTTSYTDLSAPSGISLSYSVRAVNGCGETATGNIIRTVTNIDSATPPTFSGLGSVSLSGSNALALSWNVGTPACGTGIRYNVYRSTNSGFTPGPTNRIATGAANNSYTDSSLAAGSYYYIVRAEDLTSGHDGPSGGVEEKNTIERSGTIIDSSGETWTDDLEPSADSGWTHDAAQGSDDWTLSTAASYSPTHSWASVDVATVTDKWVASPAKTLSATSVLSFYHRYQFESNWDGAVIEISADGGAWTDLGSLITIGGYNATIGSGYSNPLSGRSAWSATQSTFAQVSVNLGSFAGRSCIIRWRMGCDSSQASGAWYIDDIQMTGVSSGTSTCNPPTFAGLQSVTNGTSCSLDLSWIAGSADCGSGLRYNVYRSTSSGFTPDSTNRIATGITATSYTDSSLTSGTYYYVVRAEDYTTGNSGPNGGMEENNTVVRSGTISSGSSTVTLFDDTFESGVGLNGWTTGAFAGDTSDWQGIQSCSAHSGSKIFRFGATSCTTNYGNDRFNYVNPGGSTGIDLPGDASSVRLSFWHRWNFESHYDGATLYISTDGNNFVPIPASAIISGTAFNDTTSTYCAPSGGGNLSVWSSSQTTFTNTVVDLDSAANAIGGNSGGAAGKTLWIAFTVITDCSTTDDGWFLDDISVTAISGASCAG